LNAGEINADAAIAAPRFTLPDGSTQPSIRPFPTLTEGLLLRLRIWRLCRRVAERLCLRDYRHSAAAGRVDWAAEREHVDDHRVELTRALEERGTVVAAWDLDRLAEAVQRLPAHRPASTELRELPSHRAVRDALLAEPVAPRRSSPA